MTDERRAKELSDYLIKCLAQEHELSQRAIAEIFLGIPFSDKSRGRDYGRRKFEEIIQKTEGLVEVLCCLQKSIENKPSITLKSNRKIKFNVAPLTQEQILRAFQMLTQLTREEREQLKLKASERDVLFQQALLNIGLYQDKPDYKRILELYKASISLHFTDTLAKPLATLQDVEDYIDELCQNGCPNYLAEPCNQIETLKEKAKKAIGRLLLQAGTGQIRFLDVDDQGSYIEQYLSSAFVKRFTQAVIENNQLNEEFSVYFKAVEITQPGPFPLPMKGTHIAKGAFNRGLLNLTHFGKDKKLGAPIDKLLDQLPSRYSSSVVGSFYIRLQENQEELSYQPFSTIVHNRLKTQIDKNIQVNFKVRSRGIGGTFSHIIRVMNTALLWDIACLKEDYFPIAHDVLMNQDIVQSNVPSPVFSHSLVKLCQNQTIGEAMQSSGGDDGICHYEEFAFIDPSGRGDYCDFDALLSAARAALQARLRAIKNTGIPPKTYLKNLLHRIEQQYILDKAKDYVENYPFSSFALERWLEVELLHSLSGDPIDHTKHAYVFFDAYLTVAETFLTEGAYRKAYPYIAQLSKTLDEISDEGIFWCQSYQEEKSLEDTGTYYQHPQFKVFSSTLLIRYELCLAEYFYLLDLPTEQEAGKDDYFNFLPRRKGRNQQVKPLDIAWEALERAEQHLTVRLTKYHVINEVSQATFHPYYQLLARIYLLRAKLFIFFSKEVADPNKVNYSPPTDYRLYRLPRTEPQHIHGGRLFLLERARVFAACDSDRDLYVIATAYQCWAYLMASFAPNLTIHPNKLSVEECLTWARQLRNHALEMYAETGRRCYLQIKEKSGIDEELNVPFGDCLIDVIPPIREKSSIKHSSSNMYQDGSLYLDMAFLSVRKGRLYPDDHQNTEPIYLFGPKACYLFFIRGLCHLLLPMREEFGDEDKQPTSLSGWDKKLEHAYHLFSYAWAIADNGCIRIERVESGEVSQKIKRNFTKTVADISDSHITSVRGLYPCRITEIADLGRVFAAACAVLRLSTQSNHTKRQLEIKSLLEGLHGKNDPISQEARKGQRRYNGHLAECLQNCQEVLRVKSDSVKPLSEKNCKKIQSEIQEIAQQLFDALNALSSS
ncbi:MAG: hypothetical protein WA919_01615 [Coleofasciculaceae cyanobacterium]